tara:strand:- start:426 stop:1028 length:603 start_codon:yes stop_codon:yes gene_type:complete
MAKSRNELPELQAELTNFTAAIVNKGMGGAAERTVRTLQLLGPSWTGLYSNSWQIEILGKKSTGTRRRGEAKPIKSPKINAKNLKEDKSAKCSIVNLARSRGYAQDERLGRFKRGKAGNKIVGDKPFTQQGQANLRFENTSRLNPGYRGDIGGTSGGFSSATAPLDWFKTYTSGGRFNADVALEVNSVVQKIKSRSKRLK